MDKHDKDEITQLKHLVGVLTKQLAAVSEQALNANVLQTQMNEVRKDIGELKQQVATITAHISNGNNRVYNPRLTNAF